MMAIKAEHDLHKRRFSRNLGVGLTLAAFVALIFGLTMVKVKTTDVRGGYEAATSAGRADSLATEGESQ